MLIILFDIIYQTGDHYSQDNSSWWLGLLNTIIGAGIGSGATLFALYKTFQQDKVKNDENRLRFQKEKIQYFQSLIDTILKDLKLQISYYKDFSDKIKDNPFDLSPLQQVPLYELERVVHKLDQEDYYHSYLGEFGHNKEIVDEFRKVITSLNYFEATVSMSKNDLLLVVNFDHQRKTKLKNLVEKTIDEINGLLRDTNVCEEQNDFWNFLNTTILQFHSKDADVPDLKFYHENLVEVLKVGLLNFSRVIPEAHYLLVQMKSATHIYYDIQLQNSNAADKFEKTYNTMDENYVKFLPIIKRLTTY